MEVTAWVWEFIAKFYLFVYLCVFIYLYTVNSNSNHCFFSELPSASVRVRHTRAAAAAQPLEFEVSRCRTSQFARCFLPAQTRVWNDIPFTVVDTGTLDGFKGAVNRCMVASEFVYSGFPWRRSLWGYVCNL